MLGGERSPLSDMYSYTHEGCASRETEYTHLGVVDLLGLLSRVLSETGSSLKVDEPPTKRLDGFLLEA